MFYYLKYEWLMPQCLLSCLMLSVMFCISENGWAFPPENISAATDTAEYFPSQRFEGGAVAFYEFLNQNLFFPSSAFDQGIVGTAIVSFVLTPEGRINQIEMVNPLHGRIDAHIIQVIKATQSMWLPAEHTSEAEKILFLPLTYVIDDHKFMQNFLKPYYLGRAVIIHAYGAKDEIKEDQFYIENANKHYEAKQYQESLKYLNELIRRNPYHESLYLMRGNAYHNLGKQEKACEDFNKVRTFLRKDIPAVISKICP